MGGRIVCRHEADVVYKFSGLCTAGLLSYQRGADVGERSRTDGNALVLGERHVRLIVHDDPNAGSLSQVANVLVLVRIEYHRQT